MENISKLHKIKVWAHLCTTESVGLSNAAIIGSWFTGIYALGSNPSPLALVTAHGLPLMASLVTGAFYEANKNNLVKERHHLFPTKRMAKKVLVEAASLMSHIDEYLGPESLYQAMLCLDQHVTKHHIAKKSLLIRASLKNLPPTPGGFSLKSSDYIGDSYESALAVVMKETIFHFMENNKVRASKFDAFRDHKLTSTAQNYVLQHYPDLVTQYPTLFDAEVLNRHTLGLANVVASLTAMSCAPADISVSVKAWLSTNKTHPDKTLLPDNILNYH